MKTKTCKWAIVTGAARLTPEFHYVETVIKLFLVSSLSLFLVSCGHQTREQVLFNSQKEPLEQRQPGQPESLQHTQADQSLPQQGWVSCYRIPALATAPNGNLIAACDQRFSSCADPGCNAGLARVGERLFFSNPDSPDRRENLTLRMSDDGGKTWSEGKTICAGSSAYSSLTVLLGGDVGVLYERNDYKEIVFTRLKKSEIITNHKR
ncbi:MAG: Sialidase precursor [Bacteroidetes bacterium ADurb.Bin013]|nr:MAG: Sialidase precursor [Bacteroidetes bacterium ADurb.Bin013]